MRWGLVLLMALFLGLAWRMRAAVDVWHSDLTLWYHASRLAPEYPRVQRNYAKALYGAGYPIMATRQMMQVRAVEAHRR